MNLWRSKHFQKLDEYYHRGHLAGFHIVMKPTDEKFRIEPIEDDVPYDHLSTCQHAVRCDMTYNVSITARTDIGPSPNSSMIMVYPLTKGRFIVPSTKHYTPETVVIDREIHADLVWIYNGYPCFFDQGYVKTLLILSWFAQDFQYGINLVSYLMYPTWKDGYTEPTVWMDGLLGG